MNSLRANFRDNPAAGLFHQNRIEALRTSDKKWVPQHCVDDSRRYLLAPVRGASESCVRPRHTIQRKPKHHCAAAVYREVELRRARVSPERNVIENGLLNRMLDAFVRLDWP